MTSIIEYFELTEEHIKLLKASYVQWNDGEYGAASIDCKRPYGNSDVEEDMFRVLDIQPEDPGDETTLPSFTSAQVRKVKKLHAETVIALQIVLATGKMSPGKYKKTTRYGKNWVRV